MHKIKEVIVVEGKYDKNALSQVVDGVIIETSGFGIFNDKEKQKLLRKLAEARGLIILTDPDGAGFVIRNFIRSITDNTLIRQAYVPDIRGKEKRKSSPSKEGKLGVEGMRPQVLLDALIRAGATVDDVPAGEKSEPITKADMYARGLTGTSGCTEKRLAMIKKLELPERLTCDGLLDVLNALMSREEFYSFEL